MTEFERDLMNILKKYGMNIIEISILFSKSNKYVLKIVFEET